MDADPRSGLAAGPGPMLFDNGAEWFRPDREGLALRAVEHPCHAKRMHTFNCQHAVRSRGLIGRAIVA